MSQKVDRYDKQLKLFAKGAREAPDGIQFGLQSKLVLECSAAATAADVCRSTTKDMFSLEGRYGNAQLFEHERLADPAEARIAELERVIGRLTLELEVAKKAFRLVDGRSSKNVR